MTDLRRWMTAWIPPLPIVLAQFAFAASWLVLFAIARTERLHTLAFFGWLHLFALGSATTVALSVLTHAIPQFSGHDWQDVRLARAALLIYLGGAWSVIIGLFVASTEALQVGAAIVLVAVLLFLIAALPSLGAAIRDRGTARAIAYALLTTLLLLVATIAAANLLPSQLRGGTHLEETARSHGTFGLVGWLSLLIMGVSTRTLRPITGVHKRPIFFHIASGSAVLAGVIVAAFATAQGAYVTAFAGYTLVLLGALVYAIDVAWTVSHATVSHRAPQLFMLAAALFFVVMASLILLAFFNPQAEHAALFAGFIGWIGNAVTAHVHHIGARLLATWYLGEDDETAPSALLNASLGMVTFAAYQVGAVLGIVGFLTSSADAISIAALCGFAAFVAIGIQAVGAAYRLKLMQAQ